MLERDPVQECEGECSRLRDASRALVCGENVTSAKNPSLTDQTHGGWNESFTQWMLKGYSRKIRDVGNAAKAIRLFNNVVETMI